MLRALPVLLLALALVGCGEDDPPSQSPAPAAAPAPAPVAVEAPAHDAPEDAGVEPGAAQPGTDFIPVYDPALGEFHLDDEPIEYRRPRRTRTPPRAEEGTPIHMILRSTPSGAVAAVDGVVVGRTPAYWQGHANGKPREVTFVLPGYGMARYRFVPVTSGTIHSRLEKLRVDPIDAGVPPAPGPAAPPAP